ncbi:MAG: M15 family metallopeptidase [Oscillospiraceae bacterium]|jgi:D-alanyl-D-alanine carboxypeptidase|nr:M15 family metallopeptidase [Oscillospiraceae bacterium]
MKKKGLICVLVIILVAGLGFYFAYINGKLPNATPPATTNAESIAPPARTKATTTRTTTPATTRTTTTTTTVAAASATAAEPATGNASAYAFSGLYENIDPAVAVISGSNPYLFVVSRSYALPPDYALDVAVCVPGYAEKKLQTTAAAQYKKMYDAGQKDGVDLVPYSGYRSTDHQKRTFENKIAYYVLQGDSRAQAILSAAEYINPPGCSEHEAGLAMDIVNTEESFKDTEEYRWLTRHAADYGFILRYPANKVNITAIAYEPWHWRYVGVADAKKIAAGGLCLEEYLGL